MLEEHNISKRWNPLPLDYLLGKYTLKNRSVQAVLGLWIFLIAICILSMLPLSPTKAFLGDTGQQSLYIFYMMYPPLFLGTLIMFWLGFEWGFIPVFLSAFMVAYASYMPVYWAILFGVAFILGLGVYALCYYSISINPGLNSLKSIAFFTTVSLVAALASSLGSFVWSLYHNLSAAETISIWKGWWTGIFLQSIVLVGPFLYFLTPAIDRLKTRYFIIPEPRVSLKWIYSAIISVVLILTLFIISANVLGSIGLEQELALLPTRFEQKFLKITDSFQIISWISIGLVLSAGLAGIYLVGSWNRNLTIKVEEQTQQLHESEETLKIALEERDTLLREIHNRVNDNLTMVLALLELQLKNSRHKPMNEILKDSHARLRSMAIIYETMHQSDSINYVNLKNYTVKLSNRLSHSFKIKDRDIEVLIQADDINLRIDRAVPFVMIMNELLVNAYMHAFKGKKNGAIYIEIKQNDEKIFLTVRDNGIGMPAHFELSGQETLGMKLIQLLTRQLQGEFSVDSQEKTGFILQVPIITPAA